MPRNPLASVIVPVRNAAPYIERCLASLMSLETPLEIVVVDDGSTDQTPDVVARLVSKAPKAVAVLTQEHKGLSSARNAGVDASTGDLIAFIDADDWVEPAAFDDFLRHSRRSGVDVAIGSGLMIDDTSGLAKPFRDAALLARMAGDIVRSVRSQPDLLLLDTSACRRVVRRDLLRRTGFTFPVGLLFEDVLAHFRLLPAADGIAVLGNDFYRYRVNHPGRITDRRDASVLTIFDILHLCQDSLLAADVDAEAWARYISFQSWVLRWLGSQVDSQWLQPFADGMRSVTARLPTDGIAAFTSRFRHDVAAMAGIEWQTSGEVMRFLLDVRGHRR